MWRSILRENINCIEKLCLFLSLDKEQSKKILRSRFVLNLPLRIANKIRKSTLDDPLLRQFIPLVDERMVTPGFLQDPVTDAAFAKSPRLLQKYQSRALLVTTGACAMHCRYCFRQNYPYDGGEKVYFSELLKIMEDTTLNEVILSGGDPLSLSDRVLGGLLESLDQIPHITKIRIHTRFPIGIPERLDQDFLHLLKSSSKQLWFVIHCNHPLELDDDVLGALKKVRALGIPVLNQSVLLKGVNDDIETLCQLSLKLVDHGMFPYYLHQLDRVQGAAHFEVEEAQGRQLITQMASRLPGYAVPKYVREIPGALNKTPITF